MRKYTQEQVEKYALDYDEAAGLFIAEQIERDEHEQMLREE